MSIERITINVRDDILKLLGDDAKERGIYRAHLAGKIIEEHYQTVEIPICSKNTQ